MNTPNGEDQDLRAMLSRLPASIEPQRDLWAGIEAGIEPPRTATIRWPWALAASVASLAVGVLVTLSLHRAAPPSVAAALPAPMAEYTFVPASTAAMATKLRAACFAQLNNLPPKTRAKVEQDLDLIRASVSDIQRALGEDPGNVLLQDLLVTTYQNELHTLANVQAAASAAHTEVSL